jgi:hypothetical protein
LPRPAGPAADGAHLFAILGFLVSIAATAFGRGPTSLFNDVYHRVMLVIFVTGMTSITASCW